MTSNFQGELHWRGAPGYEQARVGRIFNARRPERYPTGILQAVSDADVLAGVYLARERGLKVSVRSGGHSWAAWSVRDDALLIDLAGLHTIELNTDESIVRVSPSVTGGELNEFLNPRGLMFPGGHCPTVGLGGFLLQGGMGWNCRGWNWACELVEAIDVVTAAGELVRADEKNNAELLWAARGAGPGYFGVVTGFYLRVRPLPRSLMQSTYVYALENFEVVMRWLYAVHPTLARSVEVVALGATLPSDVLPAHGPVLVVHGLTFADTREEALAALEPFESCPIVDQALIREAALPTTLALECVEQRRANPTGHRYAVDNLWLPAGPDLTLPVLRDAFATLPTAKSFSLWFGMAPLRPLPDMALSLQADVYFASYVIWEDEADDERCRTWLAEQMSRMAPVSAGLFLADADLVTRPARFLADANWQRLEEMRTRYDPDGLFLSYLTLPNGRLNT